MIIKKTTPDHFVRSIRIDEITIMEMANHLTGNALSKYREKIYDTDGDGKVTLKDFIQRIKDVADSPSPLTPPPPPG